MKPLLIFDFDGTICDSKELSINILNKILKSYNHKKVWTQHDFDTYFSRNVFVSLMLVLKHRFYLLPKILAAFTEMAKDEILHANMFPGQEELLRKISKQYKCIIITSNSNHVVYNFLRKKRMLDVFSAIYGFEEGRSKQKKIRRVLEEYRIEPKHTVFFTDTCGDIKEARKTGIHTIGCAWGYQHVAMLKRAEPDNIIKDVKEIEIIAKKYS